MATRDWETGADLLDFLGGIPPDRVRLTPSPGTATEADLIRASSGPEPWIVELMDGVLVNKALDFRASVIGARIASRIIDHADKADAGPCFAGKLPVRLSPTVILVPNVSFVAWDRLPDDEVPDEPIASFVPNLVCEVFRSGNTPGEMKFKLDRYFAAGVEVVWIVDPVGKTATVHDSPKQSVAVGPDGCLFGGKPLPDLRIPLPDVFAVLSRKAHRPG